MQEIFSAIYVGAAAITTPLALAASIVGLFFFLLLRIISSLKTAIEKITGANAYRLLVQILRYGFILALCALLLAGAGYIYQPVYERLIGREELVRLGNEQLSQRRAAAALSTGDQLIKDWPDFFAGYRIAGSAAFMAADYENSVSYFERTINLLVDVEDCSADSVNARASYAAALGASGRIELALENARRIASCNLDNAQRFNFAKISLISGNFEEAEDLLSQIIFDRSPPDVRDRAYITYAVLGLLFGETESEIRRRLIMANCLNGNIKSVYLGIYGQSAMPQGFSQDFEFELQELTRFFEVIDFGIFGEELNNIANCQGA